MKARRSGAAPARGLVARRWPIAVLGILALALAGCAPDAPQDILQPRGPSAQASHDLWLLVFPIAVAVFILVQGLLLVAIWRFRKRKDDDDNELPRQVGGNTRLEIIWTLIPAAILAAIAVPTITTIFDLANEPEDALEVRVIAKQYWWEFEYLGDEGQGVVTSGQLHIPAGRPVYLHMESLSASVPDPGEVGPKTGAVAGGVLHSFWVPSLAGKQDVVPGQVRNLTIAADEPGRYEGQCAEFCGLSHSRMRFQVIAEEEADFEAWLAGQAEPAEPVGDDADPLVAQGEELFDTATCIQCHAIQGYESPVDGSAAELRIGPDLTHFASRDKFAGAFLDLDRENLADWLRDPQEVKPGAQMPNLVEDGLLAEDEIEPLVEYLLTLD